MKYSYHMRSAKPCPVVDDLTSSQGSIHSTMLGIPLTNAKEIIYWLFSTLYVCTFTLRGFLIVSRMILNVPSAPGTTRPNGCVLFQVGISRMAFNSELWSIF